MSWKSSFLLLFIGMHPFLESLAQTENGWSLFAHARFKDVYVEKYKAFASLLVETESLKRIQGKEITVTGYYIPVGDPDVVILSKFPYANCFFCGGAGLESILEIDLKNKPGKKWKVDDKLTFRGKLYLNYDDWERLSFILEEAEWIDPKK